MTFNLFKPQRPAAVPAYRFRDLTKYELFLLRAVMQEEISRVDACLKNAACEGLKKEIAENGQVVARLYDEISAALLQLISDESRQGGLWK